MALWMDWQTKKNSRYKGSKDEPSAVLLKHNGLHMEIQIDREDPIGKNEKVV